ncbi:hypothetical protein N9X11_00895 [Candidatus Pelagibacter bacterium]|nr:hypothetical protein [Candidatus Pelagibacter bacterium]|tara:strand:+ start:213 stop:1973 length:1761 start_codon:yes stop_codon:yes gene_type:complete
MKNLKLLNKKYLSIIFVFLILSFTAKSQEPVDIWSLEEKTSKENTTAVEQKDKEIVSQNTIYEMQSLKKDQSNIQLETTLTSKEIEIAGLYDPAENGLDINMWSNSDGDQILNLFKNIDKINLSKDASEILDILFLTNAYYPEKNITKEQFLEIKSSWLIKNSNYRLIEDYLLKNQIINDNPELAKHLVNNYLSISKVEKACEIFSKITTPIEDEYLSKFNIYCLINKNKIEEAQLLLDLKKELGFKDNFYEKKISYLMGYDNKADITISENTILDFHLSHKVNSQFEFEPKDTTTKQIWKYLSTSNLLYNIQEIEITDLDKIRTIEKATHEKNYTEKELFNLYKRFQFSIDQLINIRDSSKILTTVEARALIYQGILITSEIDEKLKLMNALKNSFKNDGIENAFNEELSIFLSEIDQEEIPSNYTTFYQKHTFEKNADSKNIKINNKILHQSKLINYFYGEIPKKNITKDLDVFLKKIKKNKKYFFSKKDVILVETLKSDGIKVSEKYKNLYEINESEIPSDIQVLINNGDMGGAILRIVEVIGQDELNDIDADTMYFIINTLNQLNVDVLRNKILLKVLPLKV